MVEFRARTAWLSAISYTICWLYRLDKDGKPGYTKHIKVAPPDKRLAPNSVIHKEITAAWKAGRLFLFVYLD